MKMFPIVLFLLNVFFINKAQAQMDSVFFHNGKIEAAVVLKIEENTIDLKFKNEDAVRRFSKYTIDKVVYKSGRVETMSAKVIVDNDSSWNKVIVLDDKIQAAGMKRIGQIFSHTAFINLHTSHTGEKKARKLLLKEAAKLNSNFILITSDKEVVYTTIKWWGVSQVKMSAVAYQY